MLIRSTKILKMQVIVLGSGHKLTIPAQKSLLSTLRSFCPWWNYMRGDFGTIRDKDLRSTLILDNPFGATSSKHILVPMFAIAKHFRVQMICLSDINKSDVNCFNYVTAKQEPDGSLSVKCSYCHTLMIIRKRNKTSLIKLIRENWINRLGSKIQSDWNSVHDQSVPSAAAGKIRVKGKCLDEYGFVKEVVRQGIFYLWKQLGGSHNDQ